MSADSTPTEREAGDVGEVQAAWLDFSRNTPESFWDVAIWREDGNWIAGTLDVANRKAIVLAVLERIATSPPSSPTPDASAAPIPDERGPR